MHQCPQPQGQEESDFRMHEAHAMTRNSIHRRQERACSLASFYASQCPQPQGQEESDFRMHEAHAMTRNSIHRRQERACSLASFYASVPTATGKGENKLTTHNAHTLTLKEQYKSTEESNGLVV